MCCALSIDKLNMRCLRVSVESSKFSDTSLAQSVWTAASNGHTLPSHDLQCCAMVLCSHSIGCYLDCRLCGVQGTATPTSLCVLALVSRQQWVVTSSTARVAPGNADSQYGTFLSLKPRLSRLLPLDVGEVPVEMCCFAIVGFHVAGSVSDSCGSGNFSHLFPHTVCPAALPSSPL